MKSRDAELAEVVARAATARIESDALTLAEFAKEIGCPYWPVWKAASMGLIPGAYRIGVKPGTGPYRVPRSAVEPYRRAREVRPAPPALVSVGKPLIDQVMGRRA